MTSNLPYLEPKIVKFLKEKLPAAEYRRDMTKDDFFSEAVFRAGQRDIIHRLEKIVEEQKRG